MSNAPAGTHMRDVRPKAGPKLSLIAFASTAIAMALCLILSERFFMINDDSFIQLFLAGKMTGGTPTGEVVFINSFLGDVLAVLFTAFPSVPWWFVCQLADISLACYLACLALLVTYRRVCRNNANAVVLGKAGLIAATTCLACIVSFFPIARMQFTMTPAVCLGSVIPSFPVLYSEEEFNETPRKVRVLNIILFCLVIALSFSIRPDSFLMAAPFLLIAVAITLVRNKGVRAYLAKCVAIVLVILVALFSYNYLSYQAPEWKDFNEVNHQRSLYMDYPHVDYDSNPELYESIGWDRDPYTLVTGHSFFMDERVTADNFETLNSHAQAGEQSTSPFSILSEYVTFSGDLEDRVGSSAMSLAFLLSALAICLLPKRYIPAALTAVASVVAELAYLSLGGRFPLRAIVAVAYCYCFTLLMLFLLAAKDPCARLSLGRSTAANLAIAAAGLLGLVSLIQGGTLSSAWYYPPLMAPALAIILPILSQRAKAEAPSVRLSKRRQGILDRRLRLVAGASVFALSLVCFVASFSLYSLFGEQSNLWAPESEHITQRFISFSEYAAQHPDKCFILPADDNDDLSETFLDVPNNMMFYGGWSYYAPWRKALEAANGLQSPVYATDLVSQIDKLLFATTNEASAESIRAYLSHLLGREVIATECDQIGPDGMYGHVYRFET